MDGGDSSASSKVNGGRMPGSRRRHHRLAGTGRSDEQQIVSARRRHFERAPWPTIAPHVGKIGRADRARRRAEEAQGRTAA